LRGGQHSNAPLFVADGHKKQDHLYTFPRNHQHSVPDQESPQQQPHHQPHVLATSHDSSNQRYPAEANIDKPMQYEH
jgi:hypothetical protein